MKKKGVSKIDEKAAGRSIRRGVNKDSKTKLDSFISKHKNLENLLPFSSTFLGTSVTYKKPSERVRKKSAKIDIAVFRLDVGRFAVKSGICQSREGILRTLKTYPFLGDLHVLNAILTFVDSVQLGKKDVSKLDMVKDSLVEISIAIINGADCVFNVTWFIKIYLYYLVTLLNQYSRLEQSAQHIHGTKSSTAKSDLNKVRDQLLCLVSLKEKAVTHTKLQQSVKGTVYMVQKTSDKEFRDSFKALLDREEKKLIGRGKRANYVIYIHHITLYIMAHIPFMDMYVKQEMKRIPEVHRDLVLKKKMVLITSKKMNFSLCLAKGDLKTCRDLSQELYHYCLSCIEDHLQNVVIVRDFEAHPFFCLAWVVVESNKILLERSQYQQMIEKAVECIAMVAGQRCRDDGYIGSALAYKFSLNRLLQENE
ncbi:MAG: hypothetical protein GY786_20300 [Proteobacteria bacterium]|nr:hypothetical protein [Pseudomonadota bacterium]